MGKMDLLLAATLPTELSMLRTNSFQNNISLLKMETKCMVCIVYKQTNVNIAIRSLQHYIGTVVPTKSDSDVMFCLQMYYRLRIDRPLVY